MSTLITSSLTVACRMTRSSCPPSSEDVCLSSLRASLSEIVSGSGGSAFRNYGFDDCGRAEP